MFLQDLFLDHDGAVNRIDAGRSVPVRLDLGGIGNEFWIFLAGGLAARFPIADWGSSAADSCWTGKAGLQFAARHHASERLTWRRVHYVWRQRQRRNVLLVIHDPSDLGRIEAVFVGKDAPGPHPRGDRIGAHADFVAFT